MKKDKDHSPAKHPPDRKTDPRVVKLVNERARDRELTCAQAFGIANDLQVSPEEVGFTMDRLQISISRCQMGLFGFSPVRKIVKPAESVSPELEQAIRQGAVSDRLPCAVSWVIAKEFRTARIRVASACEALKLRISDCQLGAF